MKRSLIKDVTYGVGEIVRLKGWVTTRRDHGKLLFVDMRDNTGKVQLVISLASVPEAADVRDEWVIEVTGKVNARPEKLINPHELLGNVEVQVASLTVLARAKEMPFDRFGDLGLETFLDHAPLTLRTPCAQAVFKVQSTIISAFRTFLWNNGFVEFQAPKFIGEDAEGGAASFDVDYFGETAHLAQSPQFYKQIMVGVYERVFTTGNVYRAESHSTTRHLNEYTSLDIEMGFIDDHRDIMSLETDLLRFVCEQLSFFCPSAFALLGATIPVVPDKIPAMKLREWQEIIRQETDEDCTGEPDLSPQHERFISAYAQEKFGSDFAFVTHFPIEKRPMYTYPDPEDPGYTKGFDLLFRGTEITTGGQRIHDHDMLVQSIRQKGLDPEKFAFYLEAFAYGMPPHGGFGMGLERLTQRFLGLDNIRQATLFPRDMNRIDRRLRE